MPVITEGSVFTPAQYLAEGSPFLSYCGEILCAGTSFSNIPRQEMRGWKKAKIRYGVFNQETVPFLLFGIEGYFCSVHSIKVGHISQEELSDMGDKILSFLLLCDYPSGTVKVMRHFAIKTEVMTAFIEQTLWAKEKLQDDLEIEGKRVMNKYSNLDMIRRTQMEPVLSSSYPKLKYFSFIDPCDFGQEANKIWLQQL